MILRFSADLVRRYPRFPGAVQLKMGTFPGSHGKLRIIGNGDDTWNAAVKRERRTYDLLRRGTGGSATGGALSRGGTS